MLTKRAIRSASTVASKQFVRVVAPEDGSGIVNVLLDRKPVNALHSEFLEELSVTFRELEADNTVRAATLSSANPKIFSAGLDLAKIYPVERGPDLDRFFAALYDAFVAMYLFPKPLVCAVTGSAPAGGTMLALCGDFRVGVSDNGNARMGLNETLLGFPVPGWLRNAFLRTVGSRKGDLALMSGAMATFESAHQSWGLLDVLVPTEDAMLRATAEAVALSRVPPLGFKDTKLALRSPVIEELLTPEGRAASQELFTAYLTSDEVKASLDRYIKSLKKSS